MKSFKKMLLGFAFLLIAFMGAITYEGDFGYVLFLVGAPIGLLFCIIGCYEEEIKEFFNKNQNRQSDGKNSNRL